MALHHLVSAALKLNCWAVCWVEPMLLSLSVRLFCLHFVHKLSTTGDLYIMFALSFVLVAGAEDGTALEMAFSRKKIEERKAWLRGFMPGTYLDHTASDISYTDFVNKARSRRCTPHD